MHIAKVAGTIVALGIALAGCGGGGSGGGSNPYAPVTSPVSSTPTPPPASSTPTPPASSTPTPPPAGAHTTSGFSGDAKQAVVNGQTILVDATTGLALYFFGGDTTGQSNCTGGCLAIWPSHAATASETADGNFSIFTRSDGRGMQWQYKGRPLYTFVSDSASNNATGNGVENFVLATP